MNNLKKKLKTVLATSSKNLGKYLILFKNNSSKKKTRKKLNSQILKSPCFKQLNTRLNKAK